MAGVRASVAEPLVLMLAPLAPHVAEELWARLGHRGVIGLARLPRGRSGPAGRDDDRGAGAGQRQGAHGVVGADRADPNRLEAAARADAG